MELNAMIDETCICIPMKATNKEQAITILATRLHDNGYLSNVNIFLEDVYLREMEGLTGIGDHIAIPHGKSKGVKSNKIAIGILEQAISWETIDDLPVKVIILFAVNANTEHANSSHLAMMAAVAKSLAYDEVKQQLYHATTAKDVLNAFTYQ